MDTKKKKRERAVYVSTSISFSSDEKGKILPLSIPENDELLKLMAEKLKNGKIEKQPLRKQNVGIKFSTKLEGMYNEVRKKLKSLNISMSSFYKECYKEFVKIKAKRKHRKDLNNKLINNTKIIKEVAHNH